MTSTMRYSCRYEQQAQTSLESTILSVVGVFLAASPSTANPLPLSNCAASGCSGGLTNVSYDLLNLETRVRTRIQPTCTSCEDCRTILRHDLVGNEKLARVGVEHGLDTCINVNGGTTRVTHGIVATEVKAILGAVERRRL
jgi:hypothetical protein